MEQIQNHRSMDSQSIWLKSVRSEADSLDLTNPWLKEVIKSDPELILSVLYGEFRPPLSPQHVLAHLDEFWWMLQSTGWGVSQISSLIDNCTQWDSDLAQLDTDQALMDSPSAYLVYLLGIWAPPGLDLLVFVYIQAQQPLPRELELGLRCCCYCIVVIIHLK